MTTAPEREATTDDAFLGGSLRILQPASGYRAGLDAVLLAAAAPLQPDRQQQVLDVGAGVGVVGLAVARRVANALVTMVEKEATLANLGRVNIARNDLSRRVRMLSGDITTGLGEQPDLKGLSNSFDHVLANPPYQVEGCGTDSPVSLKLAAHSMPEHGLERWIRFMAAMVRPGGSATMINRPEHLTRILAAFARRFGRLIVFPLFPRAGAPAGRVLVQGIKGSRAPLRMKPGLVLHEAALGFRPEVDSILRAGAPLDLCGIR